MTRDAPGDLEIVGLEAIARYYGISLSTLRVKHLREMKQAGAVWWRKVGRPARKEYFAKEGNLRLYAVQLMQRGEAL